jgi:hypothetical protein
MTLNSYNCGGPHPHTDHGRYEGFTMRDTVIYDVCHKRPTRFMTLKGIYSAVAVVGSCSGC